MFNSDRFIKMLGMSMLGGKVKKNNRIFMGGRKCLYFKSISRQFSINNQKFLLTTLISDGKFNFFLSLKPSHTCNSQHQLASCDLLSSWNFHQICSSHSHSPLHLSTAWAARPPLHHNWNMISRGCSIMRSPATTIHKILRTKIIDYGWSSEAW